jgi:transketolase
MSTTVQAEVFDCRVAFAEELIALAREDERIVAVCNDSVGSSNLTGFAREFPDRMINVGIAEQDMVGVGSGLALSGYVPFVCAAAPFLTGRALEQIKADVAYSQSQVVLCGMSPGMAYGELGPTHHSIEDLSWLRAIAGLGIVVPADPDETRQAVRWAASAATPVFLRVGRFKVPAVTGERPFRFGSASLLRPGTDVTVVATGSMVSRALEAASLASDQGVSVRVLNMSTIAPLDEEAVRTAMRETRAIVTAEEATTTGGLGAAVAAVVVASPAPVPMRMLGVHREFAPTGSTAFLLEHFGLTAADIGRAAVELVASDA